MRQHTISEAVSFDGIGIHSGEAATCAVEPADPDTGLVARLPDGTTTPLGLDCVVGTDHATSLNLGGIQYQTTEHLLSALAGLGIDNAVIVLQGPEMPIMDGSARPFAEALWPLRVAQAPPRNEWAVTEAVTYTDDSKELTFEPHDTFAIDAEIDFPHPAIGVQRFAYVANEETYLREVASARTFGFLREVEELKAAGLIKGASLENAVVFDDKEVVNPPMRFRDEPVRHKVLDCIGDLALLGKALRCRVRVRRGGHKVHCEAARMLLASGTLRQVA